MRKKIDLKNRRLVFELDHRDMANVFDPDNLHLGARVEARKVVSKLKSLPYSCNADAYVEGILQAISRFHAVEFDKQPEKLAMEQKPVGMSATPHWLSDEEMMTLGDVQSRSEYEGDPTAQYLGLWFFFDETWISLHGPYDSRQEAHDGAIKYAEGEL